MSSIVILILWTDGNPLCRALCIALLVSNNVQNLWKSHIHPSPALSSEDSSVVQETYQIVETEPCVALRQAQNFAALNVESLQ